MIVNLDSGKSYVEASRQIISGNDVRFGENNGISMIYIQRWKNKKQTTYHTET